MYCQSFGLCVLFAVCCSAQTCHKRTTVLPNAWNGLSSITVAGNTGVSAMQMTVVGNSHVLIIDKVEHNPLQTSKGKPAWVSYMDVNSLAITPLKAITNSFCAAGSWLSNGTLIGIGGNLAIGLGDSNGLQAIRMFNKCDDAGCPLYENPSRIRMSSNRWYAGVTRLPDGSALIMGGMKDSGFNGTPDLNNPTLEYYPHKAIANSKGMSIYSKFLADAMSTNLFPVMWLLPDGTVFVAANTLAMIYDWKNNKETRLPGLPNKVIINYPWTAASALLPLRPSNSYTPEAWFCGGSKSFQNSDASGGSLSAQDPTSNQCTRMVLNVKGIKGGWQTESMPVHRIMASGVLTPDGSILIVEGAQTGVAGFDDVQDKIGSSNADHPAFTPTLYNPVAPAGQRFSSNFPASTIARMYHSSAVYLPDGRIMLAGSNPNNDVTTQKYPTEFRSEFINPPYMNKVRPSFTGMPSKIGYGKKFTLKIKATHSTNIQAVIHDSGFSTHGVSYNQRLVELVCTTGSNGQLTVTGPPNENIWPPGPAWLYVLQDGVPSVGQKVVIGSGKAPPEDSTATKYMLAHSSNP